MAGLTLAPEGSGSLAKQQLLHKLLHLRSGWTQGCRMSENKEHVKIHKLCNKSNCKYSPTTLETGNQVDENLVNYFMFASDFAI